MFDFNETKIVSNTWIQIRDLKVFYVKFNRTAIPIILIILILSSRLSLLELPGYNRTDSSTFGSGSSWLLFWVGYLAWDAHSGRASSLAYDPTQPITRDMFCFWVHFDEMFEIPLISFMSCAGVYVQVRRWVGVWVKDIFNGSFFIVF